MIEYSGINFFFDFDGTLAPIVARPEDARMPAAVRRHLRRLTECPGTSVSIISGRALSDLRRRITPAGVDPGKTDLAGICLAGNHGLEIELGDREYTHPRAAALRPVLSGIAGLLVDGLAAVPGCRVEDKGLTLSVHYRGASPAAIEPILRTVREVLDRQEFRGLFTLRAGKMVLEVRPLIGWDKGRAVLWMMEHRRGPGWVGRYLPVYVGDDRTDEDAFRALAEKGITIKVGPGPTAAAFTVKPPEVGRLLKELHRLAERIIGRDRVETPPGG